MIKIYTTIEMGSKGKPDAEAVHWITENLMILLTDRELMVSHKGRLGFAQKEIYIFRC